MASAALRGLDSRVPALPEFFQIDDVVGQLDVLLFDGETRPLSFAGADAAIWFSSTSAIGPGRYARAAACDALTRLGGTGDYPAPLTAWFNSLRARIARAVGSPEAAVLLAPSAEDARRLARFVATSLLGRAPVDIIPPANESGHGADYSGGAKIVALRDGGGAPMPRELVEGMARARVNSALEAGDCALIHAMDVSGSGLPGVGVAAARKIVAHHEGRALAVLDACQFRNGHGEIAAALSDGLMVAISGSRFLGGPAHCAALLLPAEMAEALAAAGPHFDLGIAPARLDLPAGLRNVFSESGDALMNIGLGLRWSAALAEFDRYAAVPLGMRAMILEAFARRARAMTARRDFVDLEPRPIDEDDPLRDSVLALFPRDPRGGRAGFLAASAIHAGLALPRPGAAGDTICHIGAPVKAGQSAILTIAASAPMVSDVFARMDRGVSFERAIAPIWRDLGVTFDKWEALAG